MLFDSKFFFADSSLKSKIVSNKEKKGANADRMLFDSGRSSPVLYGIYCQLLVNN